LGRKEIRNRRARFRAIERPRPHSCRKMRTPTSHLRGKTKVTAPLPQDQSGCMKRAIQDRDRPTVLKLLTQGFDLLKAPETGLTITALALAEHDVPLLMTVIRGADEAMGRLEGMRMRYDNHQAALDEDAILRARHALDDAFFESHGFSVGYPSLPRPPVAGEMALIERWDELAGEKNGLLHRPRQLVLSVLGSGFAECLSKGYDVCQNGILHHLVWEGKLDWLEPFIAAGADPNREAWGEGTPLDLVLRSDYHGDMRQVFDLLLQLGADPSRYPGLVMRAYEYLGLYGLRECVERGASVDADRETWDWDETRCSLLHHAVLNEDMDALRYLIEKGANVNVEAITHDGIWGSPLSLAAQQGWLPALELLFNAGADANAASEEGLTALHSAAMDGQLETSEWLIGAGARVNASSNDGKTPLHVACEFGHLSVAELLLCNGAMTSVKDRDGNTPLHLAGGYSEFVDLLLSRGAIPTVRNGNGVTAAERVSRRPQR